MSLYRITKIGEDRVRFYASSNDFDESGRSYSYDGYISSRDISATIIDAAILKLQVILSKINLTFFVDTNEDAVEAIGFEFTQALLNAQYLLNSLTALLPDMEEVTTESPDLGYLELYGILTQSSTNAPTITVFENTFTIAPVLTYEQVGWYLMDLALTTAAFGRIYMVLGYLESGGRYKTELLAGGGNAGKVRIYTWGTNNTTNENGKLLRTSVHVRYYPA